MKTFSPCRALAPCLLATLSLLPTVGCSYTDQGLVGGAALGGLAGAALGGRRNAVPGAIIGTVAGAALGGSVGASHDRAERRVAAAEANAAAAQAAASAQPPLSIADVKNLTANATPEDVILTQIRNTGSRYNLTANDLIDLQAARVSPRVIGEMQATANRPVAVPVYQTVPVVYPRPYYRPVYAYPPPGFGVYIR